MPRLPKNYCQALEEAGRKIAAENRLINMRDHIQQIHNRCVVTLTDEEIEELWLNIHERNEE